MKWLRRSRPEIEADVESELSFHIEMRAAALERTGIPPAEALARARAELGDQADLSASLHRSDRTTELRRAWAVWLDAVRQDVRFTIRSIGRRRGFAAAIVTTLALGIGAATAVFCVLDAVLLRPLPVTDQERVIVAWTSDPVRSFDHIPFTYIAYEQLRESVPSAEAMAAIPYWFASRLAADFEGRTLPIEVAWVTGEFFDVLGARPHASRLFEPPDDHVGAAPVIVLSESLAGQLFGTPRAAVGRSLRVSGRTYTVVGVTPPGFEYPRGAAAWTTLVPFYASTPGGLETLRGRGYYAFDVVMRAAPGVPVEQVRTELRRGIERLNADGLAFSEGELQAPLLSDVIVGDVRPVLLLLGAAVLLVLLIAGLNAANLLLVRGVTRQRELTVRAALGAGRARIVRQLATEALVLAAAAAVTGVLIAHLVLRVMLALAPAELPRLDGVGIDARAVAFSVLCAALAAVCFGVLPALRTSRIRHENLRIRSEGEESGRHAHRLRHVLVAAQIAIACIVLSTAGLLMRSLERMQALDFGFDAGSLLIAELAFPPARFDSDSAHQIAMSALARRVAAAPGVTAASAILTKPFAGNEGFDIMITGEGMTESLEASPPLLNYEGVHTGYFAALGLPIVRGRPILESDRAGSELVVVVNEAMAELYWPGENAVGRRVKWGDVASPAPWRTVVGVAGDARYRQFTEVRPSIYVPYGQGIPVRPNYLLLRTPLGAAIAGTLREIIREEEPGAALLEVAAMPTVLRTPLAGPRFQSVLTGSFAMLGLALAALGTYAVLAFFVQQRRREIGIRMALGASPAAVRRLVLRHALGMAAFGIVFGVLGTVAVGRLIQALLFATPAVEPTVLATTVLVLLAASIAAAVIPLRAAAGTDPLLVMRSD